MTDLIASAPRVPELGETVVGTSFQIAPGGKGANQAVQCARLCANVTIAGCVGDDAFGKKMLNTVRESGVDISHVKVSRGHSSGVGNIQLEVSENRTQNRILVVPGANYDLTPDDLSWLENSIGSYDLVMLQLELTMEVTKFVAACAHTAGVPVMLNPAPATPLDSGLLSCITYLSPNEYEAASLSGLPLHTDGSGINREDLNKVISKLRSRGISNVIITLGNNGAVSADATGIQYTPCVDLLDVKDPTAAGDSFVAAFCTGITAGLSSREALDFASHTAAITVSRMGALPSLPTLSDVQDLMIRNGFAKFDPLLLNALK
nr:ribokinase [Caproiciproducens sp. NJN-50]